MKPQTPVIPPEVQSLDARSISGKQFTSETAEWKKGVHVHPVGVLTGVDKGIASIESGDGAWVLSAGSVAYIPPYTEHATRMMSGYAGWVLGIPRVQQKLLPREVCVLEASDLLVAAARKIAAIGPSKTRSRTDRNVITVIVDELRKAKKARFLRIPMPIDRNLRAVADAIISKPSDTDGIDQWAKRAAMSRRSFTRHFIKETGLSFVEWRQRVKIHSALRLLSDGHSVTSVALDMGYHNVSSFIAMFRNYCGNSPAGYMRQIAGHVLGN